MSIYKTYGVLWFGAVAFWIFALFTMGISRFVAEIICSITLLILSFAFHKNAKEEEKLREFHELHSRGMVNE